MTNVFLNAQEYANTMLLLVKNQLVAGRLVDGRYRNEVTDENGLTISVKRPPRFVSNTGAALTLNNVIVGSSTLTVDQYYNVHLQVGDLEQVQSLNQLMRDANMMSAASTLAHRIDGFLIGRMLQFHSSVGTVNSAIATPAQFNAAHTRLMEMGVPNADLNAIVQFRDGELMRGSLLGGFIEGVNLSALQRTRIPLVSEVDIYASQNLPSFTTGTRTGTILVNGAAQNVNYRAVKDTRQQTLNIDGVGASATVRAGETFTIAGVFEWDNRAQPGKANGSLQRFTVLADATANASGEVALTISPPIIVQGSSDGVNPNPTFANTAFATVNAAPADNAAITFDGSASTIINPRFAFHKQAIAMVSARLPVPFTGEAAFATDPETGVSIRYWRASDVATGNHIHRWDTILGATNVDRSLGTRVYGS